MQQGSKETELREMRVYISPNWWYQVIIIILMCNGSEILAIPQPKWAVPNADRRVLFSIPRDTGMAVLVRLPFDGLTTNSCFLYACDSRDKQLPTKLVFADKAWAYVLVGIDESQQMDYYQLYAGRSSSNLTTQSSAGTVLDPLPVGVFIHRPISRSPPLRWEQMLHIYFRSGPPVTVSRTHYFGSVELPKLTPGGDKSGGPHKLGRIVSMRTNFVCSKKGWYTFALGCRSVSFLLLDGKLLVSELDEDSVGDWVEGEPVHLEAGIYPLEIFAFCEETLSVKVGLKYSTDVQSSKSVKEIPRIPQTDLITPFEANIIRIERIERVLQPYFRWEILPAYAYRISKSCERNINMVGPFIPVKFLDTTLSWTNVPYEVIWDLPSERLAEYDINIKTQSSKREVVYVYFGTNTHIARLIVRDKLGHEEQCVQTIDCRRIVPVEFEVGFEVSSLEPIYFPSDEVAANMIISTRLPVIEGFGRSLYGSLSDWRKIQLAWKVEYSGAVPVTNSQTEVILDEKRPSEISLIRGVTAGELRQIEWTAKNKGIEIASGRVRFYQSPFEVFPDSVCGNRLLDTNGVQLILVPHESFPKKKTTVLPEASGRIDTGRTLSGTRTSIVWIDENLCLENYDESTEFLKRLNSACMKLLPYYRINYIPLAQTKSLIDSYRPLAHLVKCISVAKQTITGYTDEKVILILSVGKYALYSDINPDVFQRYIAALCDMVSRLHYSRIVLLTPPPYKLMESKARTLAQAMLKVAYTRNLVVADIYSAFMCKKNIERLWEKKNTEELTNEGIDLAVQTIKTAIENMEQK